MALGMQTTQTVASEYWIPEYGLFDAQNIDPELVYQGRIYRITPESIKVISEVLGFTAQFDNPSLRLAYVDLLQNVGRLTMEMERNVRPTDLNLRYMRDRWDAADVSFKERDPMRPWTTSYFTARFLPPKVYSVIAEQIHLEMEDFPNFNIRINFREKTVALIAESKFVERFPTGAFQVFAIPEDQVPIIPTVDISETPSPSISPIPSAAPVVPQPTSVVYPQQTNVGTSESGVKYSTYSKSETDRMFKQHADSIANTLGAKISGQQRIFQESAEKQEKTFARLVDKLAVVIDEASTKLRASTDSAQGIQSATLEQFKKDLVMELDQFRAHVNKNIIPVSKQLEEKIQAIQVTAKATKPKKENKWFFQFLVVILLLASLGGTAYLYTAIVDLKSQLQQLKH